MSIIEKAVNALTKGAAGKKGEQSGGAERVEPTVDGTVQRAEASPAPPAPAQTSKPIEPASTTVTSEATTAAASPPPPATEATLPAAEVAVPAVTANEKGRTRPRIFGTGEMVKIPFKEMREKGMLTPAIPRSAIAEEYRTIKRPLLTNISGDPVTPPIPHGNLIMVTSALEGDGKTFSSISLALSIAMEQDKTVLFVDADTAKAEAGRLIGVPPNSPGLIELLEDKDATAEDFILPSNVEKLRILPAGGVHTHANELLASDRMRHLMVELSEEHPDRVIVFDSPPLLLTTEAAVLAGFMGQIVFVVSADMTPQHAVTQAIEHIGQDKMVGLVLNRSRRRSNPYHYTYGAGPYGYGSREREAAGDTGPQ
ncbi:MAG: protein-tyrosine kinase [Halioglobus sp.]|jgi:protein-tyrosine kinase